MNLVSTRITLLLLLGLLAGCGRTRAPDAAESDNDPPTGSGRPSTGSRPNAGSKPDSTPNEESSEPAAPYRTSGRALVQWKRYAALEADLMGALQLSRDQLCLEMGDRSCIRDVHLVSLGGNEPYASGLMKPSVEPLGTTPTVVDRVLLSACGARARLDAEGTPQVFTAFKLDQPLPPAEDPAIATTIGDLYRRLLARDAQPREVELVSELALGDGDTPLSAREFAALACFTVGSTTEFLFF